MSLFKNNNNLVDFGWLLVCFALLILFLIWHALDMI